MVRARVNVGLNQSQLKVLVQSLVLKVRAVAVQVRVHPRAAHDRFPCLIRLHASGLSEIHWNAGMEKALRAPFPGLVKSR